MTVLVKHSILQRTEAFVRFICHWFLFTFTPAIGPTVAITIKFEILSCIHFKGFFVRLVLAVSFTSINGKCEDSLQIIITDRARSTRWEVIVSLCLSVHTCRGGTPARSCQLGGGTPSQTPVRPGRGYPTSGTPLLDLARGYPLLGVPHLRYPLLGVPHLGYPHWTWPGIPPAGGYPTLGTPLPSGGPDWGVPHFGK